MGKKAKRLVSQTPNMVNIGLKESSTLHPVEQSNIANRIEQYKELCNDSRQYDQKMWLIPSAAYTVSGVLYSIIFDLTHGLDVRLLIAVLNAFLFSGFVIQFIKERAYQLAVQANVIQLQENIPGMVAIYSYSGDLKGHPKDRWFIKLVHNISAANYIFYIMLLVLIADFGIIIVFLLQLLKIVP